MQLGQQHLLIAKLCQSRDFSLKHKAQNLSTSVGGVNQPTAIPFTRGIIFEKSFACTKPAWSNKWWT